MTPKNKRQRRKLGDLVKVDLGDGFHSYARVLPDATFAVYDSRTDQDLPLDKILGRSILFQVAVMNHAVTQGRWKIVGHAPLERSLQETEPCFMQDAVNPNRLQIYHNGKIRVATRSEVEGLERVAVWDPEHVESRIRDHYAGRKNVWLESLKLKEPDKG